MIKTYENALNDLLKVDNSDEALTWYIVYVSCLPDALRLAVDVERGEYVKLATGLEDESEPDARWLIESRGDDEYSVTKYVPAPQWRPIESAPKDSHAVFYVCSFKYWPPYIVVNASKDCPLRDEYPWRTHQSQNKIHKSIITHWMPLPQPPQKGPNDE